MVAALVLVLAVALFGVLYLYGLGVAANVAQIISIVPLASAAVWGALRLIRRSRTRSTPRTPIAAGPEFVERPALGAQLVDAIKAEVAAAGQPVLVTGSGGFGKTTLARWVCGQVADLFADGVLWVDVGPTQDERRLVDILTDQVRLLTGEIRRYDTVSGAADAVAAALGDRRMLLVVDDVWRERDAAVFLRGGAGCVRLITTRRPPVVVGREVRVDAMTFDEASAMLRRVLPEATDAELHPLLDRCGQWPLALSLLAGTLRSLRERMPVAEAVDALVAELERAGVGVLDELADSETARVGATLQVSLDELAATSPYGSASVDRFVQLAAFPDDTPVPHRLLELLWGLDAVRTQRECDRFRGRSLVVPGAGVRLHSVVHHQLRHQFADRITDASRTLVDACRPARGWNALPADHELWSQFAHHLPPTELAELVRDFRFLVARLEIGGPLALEADVGTLDDAYATSLAKIIQQESHLLAGHDTDLALTLYSRLFGRADVFDELTHVDEALPETGLVPELPFPDEAGQHLVRSFTSSASEDCRLAWSPDGLLVGVGRDGLMRLWDPESGEPRGTRRVAEGEVYQSRLSPDGTHLALLLRIPADRDDIDDYRFWIEVAEFASGASIARRQVGWAFSHHWDDRETADLAWGPDSRTLAFTDGHQVCLWSVFETDEPVTLAADIKRWKRAAALDWHPTAGLVCLFDEELCWWPRPEAGDPAKIWTIHARSPLHDWRLAWSPDGCLLAIGGGYTILVVDPAERREPWRANLDSRTTELTWSPDSAALAWTGDSVVSVWQRHPVDGADPHRTLGSAGARIFDVTWFPSGDRVAVATSAPAVRVYRTASDGPTAPAGARPVSTVRWQPGGPLLATEIAREIRFVDPAAPDTAVWSGAAPVQIPFAWSPDGRRLVDNPGGPRGQIRLRDAETGAVLREFPAEHGYGYHTVFGWPTDEQLLSMVGYYGTLDLVDVHTGRSARTVVDRATFDEDRWYHIAASPDGAQVAVCREKHVEIVDLPIGERTLLAIEDGWRVCFLPQAAGVVVLTRDTMALWNVATRRLVAQRTRSGITHVAAHPSGRYVAAVGERTIALLDATDLSTVCTLAIDGVAYDCEFDDSGERLAVGGSAGLYLLRLRES